jgi:hypothetical protein
MFGMCSGTRFALCERVRRGDLEGEMVIGLTIGDEVFNGALLDSGRALGGSVEINARRRFLIAERHVAQHILARYVAPGCAESLASTAVDDVLSLTSRFLKNRLEPWKD